MGYPPGFAPGKTVAALAISALLAIALAWGIRYRLIEPAAMAAWCHAARPDWQCAVRQITLWLLTDQRLGWVALLGSAAAYFLRFKSLEWLAWLAWGFAGAGLALYNAELAAPALLLAGLAIVRGAGFRLAKKSFVAMNGPQ